MIKYQKNKRESFLGKKKSLIFMNMLLIFLVVLYTQLKPIEHLREYIIPRSGAGTEQMVYGDLTVIQSFFCTKKINSIEIPISAGADYHGSFTVQLRDADDNTIKTWIIDKLDLVSGYNGKGGWAFFDFRDKPDLEETHLSIVISAPDLDEANAIVLKTYRKGFSNEGPDYHLDPCLISGEETDQILSFSAYKRIINWFFIGAVFILFALANIWWFFREKEVKKYAFFVLLGTGLIMFLIMAPGSQPDEIYHYNSAIKLSNIILGKSENINEIDASLEQRNHHLNLNTTFVKELTKSDSEENINSRIQLTKVDELKYPITYLAPALGMTLGRLLHLDQVHVYNLGRLFSLFSYIGMALIAISMIPVRKELMLLICIIPMIMHQAASTSRDVLVIGMSMIFFSYYMKIIYEKKPFTWRHALISILMLAVFGPVKVVYCILALMVFVVPAYQFKNRLDRLIKSLIIPICAFIILYLTEKNNLEYNLHSSTWAGQTDYYHIQHVFEHPVFFIRLVLSFMKSSFWGYAQEMVGCKLAGLNVQISEEYVIGYMVVLLLAAFTKHQDEHVFDIRQRLILLLVFVLGYTMLIAVFLFANTSYGSYVVDGMQGRYLIPLVPLLLFAARGKGKESCSANHWLWYMVWVIELGYIVDVMNQIVI